MYVNRFCVHRYFESLMWPIVDKLGAEPGDRVEIDEPIAQIETDKVYLLRSYSNIIFPYSAQPFSRLVIHCNYFIYL